METKKTPIYKVDIVLILIIMEDTHGEKHLFIKWIFSMGLNPYYNGRYSWRMLFIKIATLITSLNPYYNGRYSWRC